MCLYDSYQRFFCIFDHKYSTTMKHILFFILLFYSFAPLAQNTWTIEADRIDPSHYYGVTVANGILGLVSSAQPLQTECVVLAGSYDKFGRGDVSNFLRGYNILNASLSIDNEQIGINNISNYHQKLDMKHAMFQGSFDFKKSASVSYSFLSLRHLPYCALLIVEIMPLRDLKIDVHNSLSLPEGFKDGKWNFKRQNSSQGPIYMLTSEANSPTGRLNVCASEAFMFSDNVKDKPNVEYRDSADLHIASFRKILKKGQKYRFCIIGSTLSSAIHTDPVNEVKRLVIYGSLEGVDKLLKRHEEEWDELWKSDIIVEGDAQSQQDIHNMIYHLYSFVREGSSLSISPMGLSGLGYNGHIFWDADTWMFPALLLLHPEIAESMIDYRYNRLNAAKLNAFEHGYKGAQYPWESADTGCEDTPIFALTGPFEHSISGCVGLAAWQYYCVTQDEEWLRQKGFPIIKATADFWLSRVSKDNNGTCHILNVVASDEWAENIDDDAFTNGVAKVNLLCAIKASRALNKPVNDEWEKVASNIPFNYFPDGVTKEHNTYDGQNIKQADVNLLAYPLKLITDEYQIKKDLKYYQVRVPKKGTPAMTQAIFSLLYARIGDADQAWKYFEDAYKPNLLPPFNVIAETKGGTNPYFITGAGGVLQTLLMGFGGLDISFDGGITQQKSILPKTWKRLIFTRIGKDKKQYVINP